MPHGSLEGVLAGESNSVEADRSKLIHGADKAYVPVNNDPDGDTRQSQQLEQIGIEHDRAAG